jgi:diketogulonate reductase-like aldo/keto reductase
MSAYRAMEDMVSSGTARAIGVSNFNASWLERLYKESKVKPSVNQCALSIGDHTSPLWGRDDETVAMCKKLGVTFEAYSPLGGWARGGTGHILNDPTVKSIGQSHNKSAAQVALRWLVQQELAVVTASNEIDYDESDLELWDFALSDHEMQLLANIV